MNVMARLALLLCAVYCMPVSLQAEVTHSVNEENGLRGWRLLEGNIEIELIQRLPDQTRAMFMNHKFSREVIEQLALSCMFQTIIRNTGKSGSGQAVSVDLTQWRMRHDGRSGGILLKEPLLTSWSDEEASPAAKLVKMSFIRKFSVSCLTLYPATVWEISARSSSRCPATTSKIERCSTGSPGGGSG